MFKSMTMNLTSVSESSQSGHFRFLFDQPTTSVNLFMTFHEFIK